MSKNKLLGILVLCFLISTTFAQSAEEKYRYIVEGLSGTLQVTHNKTLNLIFPYTIQSIDIGTQDILVEKAKGTENVLRVKAAKVNFPETNLSVITSDGKLYSFDVTYVANLNRHINDFTDESFFPVNQSKPVRFENGRFSEAALIEISQAIVNDRRFIWQIKNKKYSTTLVVPGIYVKDNLLFFRMDINNQSPIGFDIDYMRCFIRDKRRLRRTAIQETDVIPNYTYGKTDKTIQNDFPARIVLALDKFTIPDGKQFIIEIFEKNGGRNLRCIVSNKKLLQAKVVFK